MTNNVTPRPLSGRLYVAVVGAGEPNSSLESIAEEVGEGIARAGAVLVCGGLGGVMEAACKGARAAGGTTIGILPGTDRSHANPHVQIAVPTGMGEMRNVLVVRAADCVIAVGGEFGTLSEIAFALKTGTPVVGIGAWELSKAGRRIEAFEVVATASQAVDRALALAES